jgi:hypothetical protein
MKATKSFPKATRERQSTFLKPPWQYSFYSRYGGGFRKVNCHSLAALENSIILKANGFRKAV